MRKTIVEITCDDCKQLLSKEQTNQVAIKGEGNGFADLCNSCLAARVQHSVAIVALDRTCKECKGRGKVKEGYGPHNDHTWVICEVCKGNKIMPLMAGSLVRGKKQR